MVFGLGKKKEVGPEKPRVPVEEILQMRGQGLSNNQIVQALQKNGYQTHQIFDAFSQADLRAPGPIQGIQSDLDRYHQQPMPGQDPNQEGLGMPPVDRNAEIEGPQNLEDLDQTGLDEPLPPPPHGEQIGSETLQGIEAETPQTSGYPNYNNTGSNDVSGRIEEVAEAIIDEKWQDLIKDFNKLLEWKNDVEQRMAAIEEGFENLKTGFDSLQKGVVDKVRDYDKSVKDVTTEMKAVEQMFQKIVPTFTENVNELGRITKGMKKKK
jgi:uncharacterized phage infection (PIP) family protein YhgE